MLRGTKGLGRSPILLCLVLGCGSSEPEDASDASDPQPTIFEQLAEAGLLNEYYDWNTFHTSCVDCREITTRAFEERADGSLSTRTTTYWGDPGSTGLEPGAPGCTIEEDVSPRPLSGYEDHTRQFFITTTTSVTGPGCPEIRIGSTSELYVHRVSEDIFASWGRSSSIDDQEFPGYRHERQSTGLFGRASPYFVCSEPLPNRDYCAPRCALEAFDKAPTGCGLVPTP